MRVTTFFLFVSINSIVFSQVIDTLEAKGLDKNSNPKHLFTLDGGGAYPLNEYLLRNTAVRENDMHKHFFNWGVHVSYVYSMSKRFGFGLEYGFEVSKVDITARARGKTHFTSLISTDELTIKHEGLNTVTQVFMPKIDWQMKGGYRPNGFIHQFGLGLTMTKVINRNYKYELMYADIKNSSEQIYPDEFVSNDAEMSYNVNQLYYYKNKSFIGGTIMYSIIYRRKLSEKLLWSVGIRSQVNLSIYNFKERNGVYQMDQEDQQYWITRREMGSLIANNRVTNIFSLKVGLVYHL